MGAIAASRSTPRRAGSRPRGSMRTLRRQRALIGLLLVSPALAFVAVFFFVPLVLMIWMSLHRWPLLGHTSWIGLGNYAAMGSDPVWWRSLGFTVEYTAIITPILIGSASARAARAPPPARCGLLPRRCSSCRT